MDPHFPKSINLAVGGLEEVKLAFGPHPSGTWNDYQPVDVPTDKLTVRHEVFPTTIEKPGAPIIELITVKPVKLLEKPAEFKIIHKQGEKEEIINLTITTLLLAPAKT